MQETIAVDGDAFARFRPRGKLSAAAVPERLEIQGVAREYGHLIAARNEIRARGGRNTLRSRRSLADTGG